MATDKKSFILYSDLLTVVEKLINQDRIKNTNDAGELFLHILEYVNDNNPTPVNFMVDMAFEPIKLSLKRDLRKYESYIEKQSVNGKKGGRPKKAELTEITQPFILEPKKADSVSVSVSDNVNDIVILKPKPLTLDNDFDLFWNKYNKKIDSKKCKDKFKKLSKIQVETILKVVDSYIAATSDVQYRKNPLTWLNGECWKDVEVNTFLPTKDKPFGKSNQL
jgi:hypothetical protein